MCENPEHSSPPFKDDVPEIEGTEQAKAAGKEPWACVSAGAETDRSLTPALRSLVNEVLDVIQAVAS